MQYSVGIVGEGVLNVRIPLAFRFMGLVLVAAAMLHGQPTNGPAYWSTTVPDCSALQENPVVITNSAGATVGYSCYVAGTFIWFASGGDWSTSIRTAAPVSAPVGVDYSFYDTTGNGLSLDTTVGSSTTIASGNDVNFALAANQPSEIHLLGATTSAPGYKTTSTGTVYAIFYCPSAVTCEAVLPQLFYSALPTYSWTLGGPIAWDSAVWTQWSAEGLDDGNTRKVSFVVYNEGTVATAFTIRVYDSNGNLAGTGTTPTIAGFPLLSGGAYGEAGTYGALLDQVITTPLPSGVFKVLIDGGAENSAVEFLQFTGPAATTLQVAYDFSPGTATSSAAAREPEISRPVDACSYHKPGVCGTAQIVFARLLHERLKHLVR